MKLFEQARKIVGMLLILIAIPLFVYFLWHIILALSYCFIKGPSDGTALGIAIGIPGIIVFAVIFYTGLKMFRK